MSKTFAIDRIVKCVCKEGLFRVIEGRKGDFYLVCWNCGQRQAQRYEKGTIESNKRI